MADTYNFSHPIFSLKVFWSAFFVLVVSHFGSVVWAEEEKPVGTIIGIIGTVQMKTGGSEPVVIR
jgi:hypothetical protein